MAFSGVPKVSGKRRPPTDDEEMFDEAPVKKLKEYFREGYMQYGQTWAEEQFAAAAQQGVLQGVEGDAMLTELPENSGPTESQEKGMDHDAAKEEEWSMWWTNKWKPSAQNMMVPDCLGR
mmetsp:Transcript_32847/g.77395  ORF Transcript_32847/g.77395 Transcript_32847/m.77395 type:complete len:120 (+) Transcript_32847:69-428(+)